MTLGILTLVGYCSSPAPSSNKGSQLDQSSKDRMKSMVDLDYSWTKSGLGSVMELDLVIKNKNEFSVKDVEVRCEHYARSGTKIDANDRTIYDVIDAKSTKSYTRFNMGFIHEQGRCPVSS